MEEGLEIYLPLVGATVVDRKGKDEGEAEEEGREGNSEAPREGCDAVDAIEIS